MRPLRPTTVVSAALLTSLALIACTSTQPPSGQSPSAGAEPSTAMPSAPGAPTASTPPPADRTPTPQPTTALVLAVQHSRPVDDVSVAAARRLLRSGADRWSDLGQEGGRARVVAARTAAAVVRGDVEVLDVAAALALTRRDRNVLALLPGDAVDESVRVLTVGGLHPLRDPDAYPLKMPTRGRAPEVTTLTIVGDIMLARRVGRSLPDDDPAAVFRPLAERLAAADITVGNFEATLSADGSPTQGGDSFAADPSTLAGMRLAGFDAVSLANNHVGDYGRPAMLQTFARFEKGEIETFGAGPNLAAARKPLVIERGGTSVGFIGTESIGETPAATRSSPGTNRLNMPPRTGPMDTAALDRISADITRLAERVDTVVVVPHWGTQYTNVPEASQRRAARRFAAAGADLIIGGHPHWVQGWESMGDTLVVHSLGNFVFDMDFSRQTQEGLFVEIVLWDGKVVAAEPVPYVIGSDFAPRPAGERRTELIMNLMRETSRGPFAVP